MNYSADPACAMRCRTLVLPGLGLLGLLSIGGLAHAQSVDPGGLRPTAAIWRINTETWKLPGNEKMGMAGGEVLFDANDSLRLGFGSYGAVRGQRGGFITLGLAGELHQPLSDHWGLQAGLFAGGGGGRGGASIAGGGLMLRGNIGLTYQTAGYGNFTVGVSHVRFPSGVIGSTQPFIQFDHPFYTLLGSGWISGSRDRGTSAQPPEHRSNEFGLVTRSYRIPSGVVRDDGTPQHGRIDLLGVEWLSYLHPNWFFKLESEGAMGGQSSGYMQILLGGGYRLALSRSTALKVHAAAGPAGGGGVDTGGGLLLDAGASLEQQLGERVAVELSLGEARAPSRSFRAHSVAVKLNYQFDLPKPGAQMVNWSELASFDRDRLRVRIANQTYFKADPQWRNGAVDHSVSNLGVQLDYFLAPNWYVTGQGLAAYAGGAGAYMTGQFGAGAQWTVAEPWFVSAEALVGAAGGGGLAVGNGLVGQVNGALGYQLSKDLAVTGGVGRIQSLKGNFKANVAGVALVYQFTGLSR